MITPFITTPYVSRILEADGIGIYSYTSAIMSYFTLIAALGTQNYGTREISRFREDKFKLSETFWGIEGVSFSSMLICSVGWIFLILLSDTYKYYFLALFPVLIATGTDISWFFTGLEQMKYTVLRNSICRIVGIILMFVIVKQKDDLVYYMLMMSSVQLAGSLSMWSYLKKFIIKIPFNNIKLLFHLKNCFSYFLITIAISLYTVMNKVLIGLITNNDYQNGYYEQANKVVGIAKTVCFMALIGVMTSRMSYLFEKKYFTEIKQKIFNSFDLIYLVSIWIIGGIISVANSFVPLFFGPGYEPVIPLLYLMCPLLLIVAVSTGTGSHYYLPAGKIKVATRFTVIGSVVSLVGNLCLIPFMGAEGAVIGTVIGEGVISFLYLWNSEGFLTFSILYKVVWKRFIAVLAMIVVSFILYYNLKGSHFEMFLLQCCIGTIVYFGILLLLSDKLLKKLLFQFATIIWKRRLV